MTGQGATPMHPLPAGTTIEPAPDLRTRLGGRILIGGAPLTITRLSPGGARLLERWLTGSPVADDPKHQALARRLTRSGMAHLRLPPTDRDNPAARTQITVVIPVKDDQRGLADTLEHLLGAPGCRARRPEPTRSGSTPPESAPPDLTVVVIDDGSRTPVGPTGHPVELVRRSTVGGPGRARQTGLDSTDTAVVAFLDAGVLATADDIRRLARQLDDPTVVAVAPRVRSLPSDHAVARFDERRSPLDLGPTESLVGPGRLVSYVPTACLVARTQTVVELAGFDPELRYGEDVDLVWRLAEVGSVRYQPQIEVWHRPRSSVWAMAAQRHGYGSAAAPLAVRHGDAVSPARISPWSFLVFALAVAGRPVAATATVVGTGLALKSKIRPLPDLTIEALLLTARGHWYGGLSMLTAAVRAWSPGLVVAAIVLPSQRRRIATVAAAAFGRRLLDGPREPKAAVLDLTLGAIDDIAYCSGLWKGAIRARSAAAVAGALGPALTSWPKPTGAGRSDRANRSSGPTAG